MSSDIKVGDLMRKQIITVKENDPLAKIARLMKKYDVGSVIVTHKKNAIGIITEGDIIHKAIASRRKKEVKEILAKEIMTRNLKVIKPHISIEVAAKEMKKQKIKRLPVINERQELIGIISEGDIAKVLPSIVDLIEEKRYIKC